MASPTAGFPPSTGTVEDSELGAGGPRPWRGAGRSSGTSVAPDCEVLCGRVHPPLSAEPAVTRPVAPPASTRRQRLLSPALARGRFSVHPRWWVSPIRRRQQAGPADQQSHHGSRRVSSCLTTSPCRPAARLVSTRRPQTLSPATTRGTSSSGALRLERRATALWGHYNTEQRAPTRISRRKQELP